jgi:hypothetical protein
MQKLKNWKNLLGIFTLSIVAVAVTASVWNVPPNPNKQTLEPQQHAGTLPPEVRSFCYAGYLFLYGTEYNSGLGPVRTIIQAMAYDGVGTRPLACDWEGVWKEKSDADVTGSQTDSAGAAQDRKTSNPQ